MAPLPTQILKSKLQKKERERERKREKGRKKSHIKFMLNVKQGLERGDASTGGQGWVVIW